MHYLTYNYLCSQALQEANAKLELVQKYQQEKAFEREKKLAEAQRLREEYEQVITDDAVYTFTGSYITCLLIQALKDDIEKNRVHVERREVSNLHSLFILIPTPLSTYSQHRHSTYNDFYRLIRRLSLNVRRIRREN